MLVGPIPRRVERCRRTGEGTWECAALAGGALVLESGARLDLGALHSDLPEEAAIRTAGERFEVYSATAARSKSSCSAVW